jgi:hypothetical protein
MWSKKPHPQKKTHQISFYLFIFWGKISPNFNLTKYEFNLQRIFHGKNGPNLPDFEKHKFQNHHNFYDNFQ